MVCVLVKGLLQISMLFSSWMVGEMYCIRFSIDKGMWCVLWVKSSSGIVVIGLDRVSRILVVVDVWVKVLLLCKVFMFRMVSISGSISKVFSDRFLSVFRCVVLCKRLQNVKVSVISSEIYGRLLLVKVSQIMVLSVRKIVSYCRGCMCFFRIRQFMKMFMSGFMKQFRLVLMMCLVLMVQIYRVQLLVSSRVESRKFSIIMGCLMILFIQCYCCCQVSMVIRNMQDQKRWCMMILKEGIFLSNLKYSGNRFYRMEV